MTYDIKKLARLEQYLNRGSYHVQEIYEHESYYPYKLPNKYRVLTRCNRGACKWDVKEQYFLKKYVYKHREELKRILDDQDCFGA